MSDFHVLEVSERKDVARIAIHVTTPAGNNAAGKSYASAAKEYQGGSPVTAVPWLVATNPTEATAITNGSVVEVLERVEFNGMNTNAQKLAALQAHVSARKAAIASRLQEILRFWGFDGTAP